MLVHGKFQTLIKIAGEHFPSQCKTPSGISILLFQTPRTDKTVRNKCKQGLCNSYYTELKPKKNERNGTNFLLK